MGEWRGELVRPLDNDGGCGGGREREYEVGSMNLDIS